MVVIFIPRISRIFVLIRQEGDTALHVASFMGYDAVKVLVHAGADKDFPDKVTPPVLMFLTYASCC
jgi:ankyrin repeat protein